MRKKGQGGRVKRLLEEKGLIAVSLGRVVGHGSMVGLGLIVLALLFPIVGSGANAEGEPLTNASRMKAETYVYSTLAVSLSDGVNLDIVPKANGSFTSGEAELKVTTNNTTGYQVYLQTGDNTSSLKPANGMVEAEIKPVVGEMNQTNYQSNLNTWGFAVAEGSQVDSSNLSYKAIPTASNPAIITTDKLTAEDNYILGFATAIGADLPAGKYYNTVLVSVVANPIAVHTLSGITYMQEMSPYVCDYSDEEETKQLIDIRDGKSYWVAKLADGNCWMTQNLALDLDTNENGNAVAVSESGSKVELDSSNTDIDGVWKGVSKTETAIPYPNTANNAGTKSWNLGKIVLTNPTESKLCPSATLPTIAGVTFPDKGQNNSLYTGQIITETCSEWYKDVSNMTPGYKATTTSSINVDDATYDPHYLIGNYYQYGTATAGTGIELTGTNATDAAGAGLTNASGSICPRGWQLPKAGRNTSATDVVFGVGPGESYLIEDSFYNLLSKYGYGKSWSIDEGNGSIPVDSSTERLDYKPIYFVRTGSINSTFGSVRYAGYVGYAWSSTSRSDSSNRSYDLYFNSGKILPSTDDSRHMGISVRCLAK